MNTLERQAILVEKQVIIVRLIEIRAEAEHLSRFTMNQDAKFRIETLMAIQVKLLDRSKMIDEVLK